MALATWAGVCSHTFLAIIDVARPRYHPPHCHHTPCVACEAPVYIVLTVSTGVTFDPTPSHNSKHTIVFFNIYMQAFSQGCVNLRCYVVCERCTSCHCCLSNVIATTAVRPAPRDEQRMPLKVLKLPACTEPVVRRVVRPLCSSHRFSLVRRDLCAD